MSKTEINVKSEKSKPSSQKIWPLTNVHGPKESTGNLWQPLERSGGSKLETLPPADNFDGCQNGADNNDRESFHRAISPILGMAQCFGILPVSGVRSESPMYLTFKIFSPKTTYAVSVVSTLVVMTLAAIYQVMRTACVAFSIFDDDVAVAVSNAVFYVSASLGALFFLQLAPHWATLQRDWRAMEFFLDSRLLNTNEYPRLRWKFVTLTTVIMAITLSEYSLTICLISPLDLWPTAANFSFSEVLQSVCHQGECNNGIAIFMIYVNVVGVFTLNFMDVFIMLVSKGLTERYKSLNSRLIGTAVENRGNEFWLEMRESYSILSTHVKKVDDYISPIILLSFTNNLYFICLQLFNGLLPPKNNILGAIYFFSSFVFLVGKTFTVTMMVAQINNQSKVVLIELYNCPDAAYDIESRRLQLQLSTDQVCLTGMRFFFVTRQFMLAIIGTIVTYEVILLNSSL